MSTTLCFLDTETTGLAWDADVWDFACVRRPPGDREGLPDWEEHFFVAHDERKAESLPEVFAQDYRRRYDPALAVGRKAAAEAIWNLTRGATIVGAVPDFDTSRLGNLLRSQGLEPQWHYHLCDVENLAAGYLLGRGRASDREVAQPPWDSEALSLAVGVDPEHFERHTALGDARWVRAIYDAVTSS